MILHHRKQSNFPFAIFTEFDIGLDTFKEYEALVMYGPDGLSLPEKWSKLISVTYDL